MTEEEDDLKNREKALTTELDQLLKDLRFGSTKEFQKATTRAKEINLELANIRAQMKAELGDVADGKKKS